MPPSDAKMRRFPWSAEDLRGLLRLGTDATLGITDLVEAMHHTIVRRTGIVGTAPSGRTRGITGVVYGAVRGGTRWVGRGLDAVLAQVPPAAATDPMVNPAREALLAVVNGVWGDHLAASGNPLALPMAFRQEGVPLQQHPQPASGRVLVLAHGLCMNDLQWRRNGHDHGAMLAREGGYTPLYLHYNSGRHVSENGRDLAQLLGRMLATWPVPVTDLVLLGHSMGGLVLRSACHQAAQAGAPWLAQLRAQVFLGTPHHGAPMERGGHLVDRLLGVSPYVAPFARLGKARSAGITDLRFGNLQAADWQGRHHHDQRRDDRRPTPLPEGVATYLVAATTAPQASGLRHATLGDGLVLLPSALGRHRRPTMNLKVPASRQRVLTQANHWDLLDHPQVADWLRGWLLAPA
ncbi:PGAP1-like protein [Burkholderiales bacterium JOSHI_001]|nr:PGAP1-like protein [Burkholderiales bacterium JOSHI_001]